MLYLSNEPLRDAKLSNEAVITYIFLEALTYSTNYESVIFTITQLADQIHDRTTSRTVYNKTSATLDEIFDNGYLDVVKVTSCCWRIYMTSYAEFPNGYIVIDMKQIRELMTDKSIKVKSGLIRYYLLILSSIKADTKVGTYDREWFCKIIGVKPETISRYNKILEDKKLIYIYHSANFLISNTYGRYEDKELIRIEGEKRSKGREIHVDANDKRKYVAMYRSFLAGKEYDNETLIKIYDAMNKRNFELINLGRYARGEIYDLQPLIAKIEH